MWSLKVSPDQIFVTLLLTFFNVYFGELGCFLLKKPDAYCFACMKMAFQKIVLSFEKTM
jgi:hypothetical protein